MTDEQKPEETKLDIQTKSGIHLSLPSALVLSVVMAALTFLGQCQWSKPAAATPELTSKIENINNNVNEMKADIKELKRDVLDLKINQIKESK